MAVQVNRVTLAARLASTLSEFLDAVPNAGPHIYTDELAKLFAEVADEKKLGRLDGETAMLGASVAAALQGMATSLLETAQQGLRLQEELNADVENRLRDHLPIQDRRSTKAQQDQTAGDILCDASLDANHPPSSVRLLRDWFLAHLEYPFPTSDQKTTLYAAAKLSVGQVNGWMINMRRRSGWTQTAREIAGASHDRMRELVLEYKLGKDSTLPRDIANAIEKIDAYVDERSSDRVRDWMLNVIEETTASVRDGGDDQLDSDNGSKGERDDDQSDSDSDSSPLLPPKRKRPTAPTEPPVLSARSVRRPMRAAARKATDALRESANSEEEESQYSAPVLRSIRSLPRLRSLSKALVPLTVSVTLPSSPVLPPPSIGSATRSRSHRLSEGPRLVGAQANIGHGVPQTALHRTSSIRDARARNSSGSSLDSTVPGTPEVDEGDAEPVENFHLQLHPLADDLGHAQSGPPLIPGERAFERSTHLPAPYRPQYGSPVAPLAPLPPPPPSHAYSHGPFPYETHPEAYPYPHPYGHPYPVPFPAEYAYAHADFFSDATRPAHPRQYSWAGEQPSVERKSKRSSKRRALSQQLPPPPMHQQYYAPPHAYGYHPMYHPQHPHHAQYIKQEPHPEHMPLAMPQYSSMPHGPPHHVLPPLPPAPNGPEADRLAVLRARKERMAAEQEEIRLEEESLGLADH